VVQSHWHLAQFLIKAKHFGASRIFFISSISHSYSSAWLILIIHIHVISRETFLITEENPLSNTFYTVLVLIWTFSKESIWCGCSFRTQKSHFLLSHISTLFVSSYFKLVSVYVTRWFRATQGPCALSHVHSLKQYDTVIHFGGYVRRQPSKILSENLLLWFLQNQWPFPGEQKTMSFLLQ
jgi:hypothetical protein